MIKCPVCRKEINELDESCPHCHIKFEDMEDEVSEVIEQLQEDEAVESENLNNTEEEKRTNADYLSVMANVNIILSIIGAIAIWCNFGTTEEIHKGTYLSSSYTETVANWFGIIGGIAVLITGFTLFFLLKTIVDIYRKVEK